jgi:indole-3-glycerol phosphate synthase/phosphoribosylanthranilate isomerase
LPRAIVGGGIGPGNVRAATGLGAFAIDAGSALDVVPGLKSPVKTRALFEALRPASRQRLRLCA